LHDFHVAKGARMVDFAGWEMPVQYRSILDEHKAVRASAGLFDVSHMGEVDVRGPDARSFLNRLVTNDVEKLFPSRALYTPVCHPQGGTVDDVLVYMRGPENYFLCVNAGNVDKDLAWMRELAAGFAVTITDRSSDYALLAVQGPRAIGIVQSLTEAKLDFLKYYHFTENTVGGLPCLISRTGYTGEDGCELYHAPADSVTLAGTLLAAGASRGLELCGLGARDSLRLEAGYPLYGHEITRDISPLTAGLGWTVKLDKGVDFTGRAALLDEKEKGSPHKVIFFKTGDRRIVRAESAVLDSGGAVVGRVISGTLSPILNEAIGSALVATGALSGLLMADIRGVRLPLQPVNPPFVKLRKLG
jgi:aminomethyltransferase